MDEITGGSPYGASTLAEDGNHGYRQPSQNEIDAARFQGWHVTQIASALRSSSTGEGDGNPRHAEASL
jgi:NAD(P)H dehydrogenase (quinone)